MTSGSLSGQNKGRRAAGAGSSPARSKLWQKLREYDRKCEGAQEHMRAFRLLGDIAPWANSFTNAKANFARYDTFRKNIRWKLKQRIPVSGSNRKNT